MSDENNYVVNFGRPEIWGGIGSERGSRGHKFQRVFYPGSHNSSSFSGNLSIHSRLSLKQEVMEAALATIRDAKERGIAVAVVDASSWMSKSGEEEQLVKMALDGKLLPVAMPDGFREVVDQLEPRGSRRSGSERYGRYNHILGAVKQSIFIGIPGDSCFPERDKHPFKLVEDRSDWWQLTAVCRANLAEGADVPLITEDKGDLLNEEVVGAFANDGIRITSSHDFLSSLAQAGLGGL